MFVGVYVGRSFSLSPFPLSVSLSPSLSLSLLSSLSFSLSTWFSSAGTFTDDGRQCYQCPGGYYNDANGASSCKACLPGTASDPERKSCAPCSANTAAPRPASEECIPCDANAIANEARTNCVCDTGYYAILTESSSETGKSKILCMRCDRGMRCDKPGLTVETLITQEGWWRSSNTSLAFYRCPLVVMCDSGVAAACRGNREGPVCGECVTDCLQRRAVPVTRLIFPFCVLAFFLRSM